jgi:hypothetical protein
MPDFEIPPIVKNVAIALAFFVVGRWIYIQMGTTGIWVIAFLLVAFYAVWWTLYRRSKRKK